MLTAILRREAPRRLAHEIGIAYRSSADDDTGDPLAEPALDRAQIANAAAELHGQLYMSEDLLDRLSIHRLTGERAVEIDDMEIGEPLAFELLACAAGSLLNTVALAMSP